MPNKKSRINKKKKAMKALKINLDAKVLSTDPKYVSITQSADSKTLEIKPVNVQNKPIPIPKNLEKYSVEVTEADLDRALKNIGMMDEDGYDLTTYSEETLKRRVEVDVQKLKKLGMSNGHSDKYLRQVMTEEHKKRETGEALMECMANNLFLEYDQINRARNDLEKENPPKSLDKFSEAQWIMYGYIVDRIRKDPHQGGVFDFEDDDKIEALKKIRKAGILLNEEGGINMMANGFIWSFVPERFRSEMTNAWLGIGEWVPKAKIRKNGK
jgi:hypothetical protein